MELKQILSGAFCCSTPRRELTPNDPLPDRADYSGDELAAARTHAAELAVAAFAETTAVSTVRAAPAQQPGGKYNPGSIKRFQAQSATQPVRSESKFQPVPEVGAVKIVETKALQSYMFNLECHK